MHLIYHINNTFFLEFDNNFLLLPLPLIISCSLLTSKWLSCLCRVIGILIRYLSLHPNTCHQGFFKCLCEHPLNTWPHSSIISCRPLTWISVSPKLHQDQTLSIVIIKNHPTFETPLFSSWTITSYPFSSCSLLLCNLPGSFLSLLHSRHLLYFLIYLWFPWACSLLFLLYILSLSELVYSIGFHVLTTLLFLFYNP